MSSEQEQVQQPEKKKALSKQAQEEILRNHKTTSYWPFTLAVALSFVLLGFLTNLIILGIGVVFSVVAIIGWSLERR